MISSNLVENLLIGTKTVTGQWFQQVLLEYHETWIEYREVFALTEKEEQTEIELEIGIARLRVVGTESFVREVISKPEELLMNVLHFLTQIDGVSKGVEAAKKTEKKKSEPAPPSEDWQHKISDDSGLSVNSVEDIFQNVEGWISVHDWPTTGNSEDQLQEIALIVMYANSILTGEKDFSSKSVYRVFKDLGIEYDKRVVGGQLTNHTGMSSPKSKWLRINTRGRNDARQLLKKRELELESQ